MIAFQCEEGDEERDMHTEEKNGLIEKFCSGSGARNVNKLCDQGFVGGVRSLVNIKRVVLRLFRSGRKGKTRMGESRGEEAWWLPQKAVSPTRCLLQPPS